MVMDCSEVERQRGRERHNWRGRKLQLKWCRIIKLEFCVFNFGETTPFDFASSIFFFY